jgi:hypothetical protein
MDRLMWLERRCVNNAWRYLIRPQMSNTQFAWPLVVRTQRLMLESELAS